MSSYFCFSFQNNELCVAKAGPSKEAAPVLEIPEKDGHKQRFEKMMEEIIAGKSGLNSRGEQSLHSIDIFSECISSNTSTSNTLIKV